MEAQVLRWMRAAVVFSLSAALVCGLFLPVYTDEIAWRFQERAGFDGVDKMFSEVCGPNTLAAPPWFMWPARWYSAFFNGVFADPFWIRISGMAYALAWVALTLLLVRRLSEDRDDRAVMSIVGLGLLALGTMPLLMVWSRPEQPIMLATLAAMLVAFRDGPGQSQSHSTARQAWARSAAIAALTCIGFSYHMKGLFVLPIMLACLVFASRGTKARVPKLAAGALMLAATISTISYWQGRLDCPGNAILAQAYARNNLSAAITDVSSLDGAMHLLARMIGNISIFDYVASIGPQIDPLSYWLEHDQLSNQASYHWFLALVAAWGLALAVAAATALPALVNDLRARRLDPRIVLAALAFGVAIAWSATQEIRNVYEAKFVLPLLALGIVLALSTRALEGLKAAVVTTAAGIGLFAVVSVIGIGAIYAPSFARAASQGTYLKDQPFSVSAFGYSRLRPDIEAAARSCGIDPLASRAVMIDDATYFAFIHSKLPQHHFGVIGGWNGRIGDPIGYLESRRSDGAVLACRHLQPDLRRRAKSVGEICCLAPPGW